ncbi:hypothetical protein [Paenibacillus sp. FSL R7-0331]|uniref:hypothetical protein n=1 Tax=Paenibacillus sp. FSL R7-0331 TaxID=1536773 RepID=UPI000B0607AF|nr:hypothetical protein [Paenibacillus sp. FSL R7-0331]
MSKGIRIEGFIFAKDGDIDPDEFYETFIDLMEAKGWLFGGGVRSSNEDEE